MQVSELSVRTGKCISPARSNICSIPRTSRAKNRAVGCWPACCVDGAIAAVVGSAGRCVALSWGGPAAWRCTGWGDPCLWQRPGALLCVGCAGLCCRSLCLLRLRGGASATGAARWYMAAAMGLGHFAGGGAFPTRCTGRCAARCLFWSGRCALRRTMRYTRSNSGCWPGSERFGTPGGTTHKIHARKTEKSRKMCCKTSAQYYIIKLYLSMPA